MHLNSKIYVAGHNGLVGSTILKVLREMGYENIITRTINELDLRRQSSVESFFEKERPEYVFLAAARVGGIWVNNFKKADFIYDNLMIASNVIYASYLFRVKKLLNLGSSCIYPKFAPQPLKEEYLLSGLLESTNEAYAVAKISTLKLCRYFNEQHGTNFISVMPTNLYGPNDNFNLETAHVLPAIIRKLHLAKLLRARAFESIRHDLITCDVGITFNFDVDKFSDNDIEKLLEKFGLTVDKVLLWGTGNVYREFLYVDDLVYALIFIMKKYNFADIGECINIGIGVDLKISELAEMVKRVVGFKGVIEFDFVRNDGTPKKVLDVSRIFDLGWRPKTSLKDGINKTYNWYLSGDSSSKESVVAC